MTTVRLCAVCAAHAPAIEYYASDPAVAATTSAIPHPYPAGGGDAFVKRAMAAWQAGTARTFCILVDHLEAGVVGLSLTPSARAAELGFWVAKPYWGRGIATRAVDQLLAYGRHNLGLDAVWSSCLAENHASRRVHEKCGFALRGRYVISAAHSQRHAGRTALRFCLPLTKAAQQSDDPSGSVRSELAA